MLAAPESTPESEQFDQFLIAILRRNQDGKFTSKFRSSYPSDIDTSELVIWVQDGILICNNRNSEFGCSKDNCVACFKMINGNKVLIETFKFYTSDGESVCVECWNRGYYKENSCAINVCTPCNKQPLINKVFDGKLHVSHKICKNGAMCEFKPTCHFRHPEDLNEVVYTKSRN